MARSNLQPSQWGDDFEYDDYYSNPLLSKEEVSAPVIRIRLTDNNDINTTNNVVKINPFFYPAINTSKQIDTPAISDFIKTISNFKQLEKNWDGYNGTKPNDSTIKDAIKLLKKVPESIFPHRIGLSNDGEISLIWEKDDLFADFGVIGDGMFCYFIKNKNNKLYGDELSIDDGFSKKAKNLLTK